MLDAVVVGSGPNGLAAAVVLARAGLSVEVLERHASPGGGARTAELTLDGYRHDVCSAVHPMALASPFFRAFGLEERVDVLTPEVSYAHALGPARSAVAYRDLDRTADGLGVDGSAWRRLFAPLVSRVDGIADFTLSGLIRIPRDPLAVLAFGFRVLEQGSPLWNVRFREDAAPALLAGVNAHSIGRMPRLSTAGAGLALATHAHAGGWPMVRGGSGSIIAALIADLEAHGGRVRTGVDVRTAADLPAARARLFDISPRALVEILGAELPARYRARLGRFRYGDGVAKVDFALSEPVPWADPALRSAPTIHAGGTRAEVAGAEAQVAAGRHPDHPYLLINQPTLLDPGRAPAGGHVLWAYTHVPAGSTVDPTETVIRRIEEFAPGFRDTVLASHATAASGLEAYNPNYVGGDISAGAVTLRQLLARPVLSPDPWRTPLAGTYLSSSSTPPGPSVHGMAGFFAARSALRHEFGLDVPDLAP